MRKKEKKREENKKKRGWEGISGRKIIEYLLVASAK